MIFYFMEGMHKALDKDKSLSKNVQEWVIFKPESLPINSESGLTTDDEVPHYQDHWLREASLHCQPENHFEMG